MAAAAANTWQRRIPADARQDTDDADGPGAPSHLFAGRRAGSPKSGSSSRAGIASVLGGITNITAKTESDNGTKVLLAGTPIVPISRA